jgi:Sulfotransferase domain
LCTPVWLASYPNSGTSYTMTLVERASNRSTATHYGDEVTLTNDTSVPVHDGQLTTGPYWEGLHGRMGRTVRQLPDSYILTKTHCGGRCIHCGATQYSVNDTSAFLRDCLRTSYRINGTRHEAHLDPAQLARIVHLFRNPLHNVVARYHLDRRHLVKRDPSLAARYPYNATGFQRWCRELDELYEPEEDAVLETRTRRLLEAVPCRGEFYKYTQWHEHALNMSSLVPTHFTDNPHGDHLAVPVLVVHYEDYQHRFNWSVARLMDFVEQDVVSPLRPFRALPTYEDHYTSGQIESIRTLIRGVATPRLWRHLERYF